MTETPRVFTTKQMLEGLSRGGKLAVDRRDAPELPELLEFERLGLVSSKLIEFDEQSSVREFQWCVADSMTCPMCHNEAQTPACEACAGTGSVYPAGQTGRIHAAMPVPTKKE